MDDAEFWLPIQQLDDADRVFGRIAPALSTTLARLPIPQIAEFHTMLMDKCDQLLSWELLEAAEIIHRNSVSEDSLCYFRLWIIAQGKGTFDDVLADPDALAEHPRIARLADRGLQPWSGADYPHAEEMLVVCELAFDRVLAKLKPEFADLVKYPEELDRRPREIPYEAVPAKFGDGERVRALYPRLINLFSWPL